MKVIFISGAASENTLLKFKNKYAKKPVRFVQQWWDYSFAAALHKNLKDDFLAISFPPVSTFPSSKCLFFKGTKKTDNNCMQIVFPQVINLPVLKQLSLIFQIKKILKEYCEKNLNEQIIIITHCIYLQSAIAAFSIKKIYNISVYTIVPDLPHHSTSIAFDKHIILKKLYSIYNKINISLSKKFDGYICFSEKQMQYLNQEKPHIVMEGFFDFSLMDKIPQNKNNNKILYAGGLMYRYGIKELVDGFIHANISNAELYIFGDGEAREYIKGKEDYGVFYKGSISREEIIKEEKNAFLLINPRPNIDEYTKCSFPSKLMEYMASGTPTITSRLESIGCEYNDKMVYIESITMDNIAQTLKECFNNKDKLKEMGSKASEYIRRNKSVEVQANRVLNFIIQTAEKNYNA